MLEAIFETMISAHDERYIEKTNRDRTIKIPTLGVRTTQFELTVDMSRRLFESGQEAAEEFLRTFKP
jgi:NTE family protein